MPPKSRKPRISTSKGSSLSSKTRKANSQTGSESNSRCSTPNSNASRGSTARNSSRLQVKAKSKPVSRSRKFYVPVESDFDGQFVYGSDLEAPSDGEDSDAPSLAPSEEEQFQLEEDIEESDDDDWSETSSVSRKRVCRAPTPEFIPVEEIPNLELPPESEDLPISGRDLMQILGIYEIIRHYSSLLRISPFKFEDFCMSLTCDEQCSLISEVFASLMKALLREEEGNQTWYGPPDLKDSINVTFFFLDSMTWYECARAYLDSAKSDDFKFALPALSKESYFATTLTERLTILQCLTDLFLASNGVREDILKEGNIRYDEHCRYCHKLGDLLCCETCSAVYHLECVDPPLSAVPDDDWHCGVCLNHKQEGVTDCKPLSEKNGFSIRHVPIGLDRYKRRYWFLARRLIVEGENEVLYYSSKQAFDEVLEALDKEKWERSLVRELEYVQDEIYRQMAVTAALTNRLKAGRNATLENEIEKLQKIQDERAEKRRQEEEEKLRLEEEERQKLEESREEGQVEEETDEPMITEQKDITESVKTSEAVNTTSEAVSQKNVTRAPDGTVTQTSVEQVTVTKTTTETTTTLRTTVTTESPDKTEAPTGAEGDKPAGQKIVMKNQDGSLTHITVFTQPNQQIQNLISSMKSGSGDAKPNLIQLKTNSPGGPKPAVINLSGVALNDNSHIALPGLTKPVNINVSSPTRGVNVSESGASEDMVNNEESKQNETQSESTATKTEEVKTTTESSEASVETRRISTRLKTGSLIPKFMDEYVTATKGSLAKAAAKLQMETVTTEKASKDKDTGATEVVRMTRSRAQAESMGVNHSYLFRLGEEGHYKQYENEYSINSLALNKQQHGEERDKKRQLSHKFSLTPVSEFKWSGSIYGNKSLTLATLREALKLLENNIPPHFMHPAWASFRNGWARFVNACSNPIQFAHALCKLELVIKPVLFNHSWHESLGHWRLKRITLADREEQKRRDRELERKEKKKDKEKEEEELDRSHWCKYTLGLKHQVYKQKGEEYRIVSGDGWMWCSATRVHRIVPQDQCGLRALAKKIQAKRRQAIELKIEEHLAKLKDANYEDSDDESSIASGEKPKVEAAEMMLKSSDVTKVERNEDVDESQIKAETNSDTAVKPENGEIRTKLPKIIISNDPSTPAKTENESDVTNDNTSAVKSVVTSFATTPEQKIPPTEETEAKSESAVKQEDSSAVIQNNNESVQKTETGAEVKVEPKTDLDSADKMEVDENDVKSEKGSESTASAKSEIFELDDVKVEVQSEGSRSKTVTPKPETDDNSMDIDSAAIEKMLTKQVKFDHVLNVSEAMLKRDHYPKVHKPYSKLDVLLDRRQKQYKIELQQKQILDAVLLRCRVQTIQKKKFAQELEEKKRKEKEMAEKENEIIDVDEDGEKKKNGEKERMRSDSETDSDIEVNSQADDLDVSGLHKSDKPKDGEDSEIDAMDMGDVGMGKSQIELSVMGQYRCYSSLCRNDENYQCYSALCNLYKQRAEDRDQDMESLNEEPIKHSEKSQDEPSQSALDPLTGETVRPPVTESKKENDEAVQSDKASAGDTSKSETSGEIMDQTASVGEVTENGKIADNTGNDSKKQQPESECEKGEEIGASKDKNVNEQSSKNSVYMYKSREMYKTPEEKRKEKAAEVKAIQEKYSIQQKDGNTFIMYGERFKVIEQSDEELESKAKNTASTYDALNLTNFTHAGKLSLPPIAIPDLEVKSFMCGKTKYKFVLLKHHTRGRSTRSRLMLKKGAIPNIHQFQTQHRKSSILILERFELRSLARAAGKKEVNGFKYDCKMNNVLWPYPCPRPRMKTCWRYRMRNPPNIAAIALQVRILWASLRWDDLAIKAPQNGENTVTTDEEIRKKEIVDRREIGAHGLRSQFLVREIIIPLNIATDEPKRDYTPIRSGLRERKRPESPKVRKPLQTEKWINEEALELWEIKRYYEKEDEARLAEQEEQKRKEESKRPDEILTEQLELKKQRLEAQQKRLGLADGQKENDNRPHIIRHYLTHKPQSVVRVVPSTTGSGSVLKMTQVQSPGGVVTKVVQPKTLLPARQGATGGNVALRPKIPSEQNQGAKANLVPAKTTIAQIKPTTPGGPVQNLRIMQLPDGGYHVDGLQPGQQLVKLPGGRFQVITPKRPVTAQAAQPASTANRQIRPAIQPAATNSPAATRVVRMQTPSGVVVRTLVQNNKQDDTATTQQISSPTRSLITTPQNTTTPQQVRLITTLSQQPLVIDLTDSDNSQTQQPQAIKPRLSAKKPQKMVKSGVAPHAPTLSQLVEQPQLKPKQTQAQLVQIQLPGQAPRQLLLSADQLEQIKALQAQGKLVVTSQGTVATSQSPTNKPAPSTPKTSLLQNTAVQQQAANVTPQAPGGLVLVRTPTGQLAYMRKGQSPPGVTSPPILGAAQLLSPGPGLSPPAGSVSSSVVQQMLQQAMQTSEDPEIQAKIAKIQRKMGSDMPVKSARRSYDLEDAVERARDTSNLKQHLNEKAKSTVTGRTKVRWPRSKEEMEDRTVSAICQSLMKSMLDKIERSERKVARLQKKSVAWSEKKERARSCNLVNALHKQKDSLKTDMMRKRSLMEKTLQQEVQAEIEAILETTSPTEKERKRKHSATQEAKETKKRRKSSESHALLSPQRGAHATPKAKTKTTPVQQRKQQQSSRTPPAVPEQEPALALSPQDTPMSARKRHKLASASRAKAKAHSQQLYCICKMPYDDTKFYVGCDLCSNWFHGSCIGISEQQAKKFDSYVCDDCKKAKEDTDEELYCICRQPYDDKQFYVGCDGCQDWFHADCVGITREVAELLDSYWCPTCEKNKKHEDKFSGRLVQRHHWELLKQVWSNVKAHKMAWPFLQPVDPDEVPDYYNIITNPMDLKTIKEKLDKRLYKTIGEFVKDMFLIFNNCRMYNPPSSPFFQCAEVLEIFFDKKQLSVLRSKIR